MTPHPHHEKSSGPDTDGTAGPHGRDFDKTPLVVTWEVTQACDLACDHCRATADPDRDPDELSREEAESLFEQVASFSPSPFFVLSGGDPLKRPDVYDLLDMAVDAGLTPSITPATTPLLDRAAIKRFVDCGVGRMALSLDGATAPAHDRFRGEPGTFDCALDAAATANELGLSIQINTTVTAGTIGQLPAIADLVAELGAAMWEVFVLVPVGRGTELAQLSRAEARDVTRWLYRRSRDAPYRIITVEAPFYRRAAREVQEELGEPGHPVGSTGAGNGFVFVSHTGEVYPSGFMPMSVGNVRETPLPELYREAPLMRRLRDPDELTGVCGRCDFSAECGGSRSRAFAATGDPFGIDPLCPWSSA